jgi:maleate cis-trans isomerase
MSVESAIQRLQALALACEGVKIKQAPDYPIDDAAVLPMSIAHIISGTGTANNADTLQFQPTIAVDIHFSRVSLRNAYTQASLIALEYMQRLAGDPTLDGAVDTIVFPVAFRIVPATWDDVTTQMLRFEIPLKTLETPTATST